ncbi:cryptochrome/photolyase family protein [Elongatibacter sediminis]|uniref:Cryptochrome/photolyase family protein n=1 Tax=Elongatibacter sediminis TaxID=3119006 RepID=A0AAW9RBI5_9GAMM
MKIPRCSTLRLLLGDQLDRHHPWFESADDNVLYVLAELRQEATYVRHHIQKIAAFFAAMHCFAEALKSCGHRVVLLDLDETADFDDLPALLDHLLEVTGADRFEYQRPDEHRLLTQLEAYRGRIDQPSSCCRSHHFLLPFDAIRDSFPADRQLRMETFYRRMRKRHGILVDDDGTPTGGQWNYDKQNRKPLPEDVELPEPLCFDNDAGALTDRIRRHGIDTLGTMEGDRLDWPVCRTQSLELLEYFTEHLLAGFGRYQDALSSRGWALFHSRLSFALNAKILSPREVIERVLDAWRGDPDNVPLAAVEGFVRQILGWREYMRGIYWSRMPGYADCNELDHRNELPAFYWNGETRMACMRHAIGQSLEHAYAHHIQRLMVTGNFALLAGVDPDAVDTWYLGIYIDAVQWVELPNTRGMSQYADGGVVASKPYAASGNYINRMGDHCADCHYDAGTRSGDTACPFNCLYWHFMERHREWQKQNPRSGMIYRNWDRMDEQRRSAILDTAERYLKAIDEL